MQTADVVVIGAGINGAAIAYNLAKRGLKNVVLVEKHLLASGGTGRSAAFLRQHYSNEELVRMAKRSVEIFRVPVQTTRRGNSGLPVISISGCSRCGKRSLSKPAQYGRYLRQR